MSRRKKMLQKMRQNPKNIGFEHVETVLTHFEFDRIGGQGSHRVYEHSSSGKRITLVYRRPHVKQIYIQAVVQLIDDLMLDGYFSEQDDENGTND